MRLRAFLPIFMVLLAAARPAFPAPGDPAAAAVLFQEGREASKRGDYPTACAKLTESYRLDPAVGTMLNLADCEEHLGKVASAWQHYQQAVEQLPETDRRVTIAKQRAAKLALRLPRLTVALAPGAPPGTRVTRGAMELGQGSLDTALPVDPGLYTVVVTAPERQERRFEITVAEGEAARLEVSAGPPAPKGPLKAAPQVGVLPAAPQPVGHAGLSPTRTAGIVVGGVGLGAIGAAVATGLILKSDKDTLKACYNSSRCTNDKAALDAANRLGYVNFAAWITGTTLTALGVTLIIVGGSSAAPKATALSVHITPGGAGATLEGRF